MTKESHRKGAFVLGGHGRGMQTKMSKRTKHRINKRVHARRRRQDKATS